MKTKLLILQARAATLADRGSYNDAIVKHLLRRIRNIKNAMAQKVEN